jgi:hypothetical protein
VEPVGPWLAAIACTFALTPALAGCGGSGSGDHDTTALRTSGTTTVEAPPTGPLVRICDRSLADEIKPVLRSDGFQGSSELRPQAIGAGSLSACNLGPVELSLDLGTDAVQRYQNRIVETAQFSESIPSRVPRTVKGVGAPELGAAGANWIPFLHQLLSARGKRVLIVTVNGGGLGDSERLDAAKAISLAVWGHLG